MAVMKSQLVLATLFLAGLVARGAEASIAGVVYCSLQCLTLPNLLPKATVRLQINSYEIPTAGNQGFIRRNSKGQFVVLLNVTSSEMMGSLMSGSGRVAVIAPPPPAGRPWWRRLSLTAQEYSVPPLQTIHCVKFSTSCNLRVLRELADDIVPTGVSYGGDTVDAYVAFDVGPFS
uniref:Uncharacterized protein n=1 Tax=Oryza barthii TaxID=65489 RepID=A0A0D3GUW6_9ORYZ